MKVEGVCDIPAPGAGGTQTSRVLEVGPSCALILARSARRTKLTHPTQLCVLGLTSLPSCDPPTNQSCEDLVLQTRERRRRVFKKLDRAGI